VQAILNRKSAISKKLQSKAKAFKDKNVSLDDVMNFIEDMQKALGKTIEDTHVTENKKKLKIIGDALCRLFYCATAHLCENVVLSQIEGVLDKVKELLIENSKWLDGRGPNDPTIDSKSSFWLQDKTHPIYRASEKVESLESALKRYRDVRQTIDSLTWEKTVEDFFRSVLPKVYGPLLSASQDKKPLTLHVEKLEDNLHTLKCETLINDRMMPSLRQFEGALEKSLDVYVAEKASSINQLISKAEFHFARRMSEGNVPPKSNGVKSNDANNIYKALGGTSEQQPLLIKLTKLQSGKYRMDSRKLGFYSALLGLARFISCCFPNSHEDRGVGQYFKDGLVRLARAENQVKTTYGCTQHYPVYLRKDDYNENVFEFLKKLLDSMILEFYRISYNKDEKPKPKEPQDLFNARITNITKSERDDPPSLYWKVSSFLKATLLHKEGIQLAIETLAQGYEGAAMLDRLLSQLATGGLTKEEGVNLYKQAFSNTDLVDKLFLALTVAEEFLTMLYRGDPSPRCTSNNSEVGGLCIDSPTVCTAAASAVLKPVISSTKPATLDEECKERLCPERGDCPNLDRNFKRWALKLHPDKNLNSAKATADFQKLSECREKLRNKVKPIIPTSPPMTPPSPTEEDHKHNDDDDDDEYFDHSTKLCQLMGCKKGESLKDCKATTRRKNSRQDDEFIRKRPNVQCKRDAKRTSFFPSPTSIFNAVRTGWSAPTRRP